MDVGSGHGLLESRHRSAAELRERGSHRVRGQCREVDRCGLGGRDQPSNPTVGVPERDAARHEPVGKDHGSRMTAFGGRAHPLAVEGEARR